MAARAAQKASIMPALVLGGIAAMALGVWNGLPGPVAVMAVVLAYAWTEPAPEMTGARSPSSRSSNPANPEEAKKLESWQAAQAMRFAPLGPGFAPGWPVQASFIGGLAAAAVAALLPTTTWWMPLVSAIAVFAGLTGFASARRKATGNPGTRTDTIPNLFESGARIAELVALTLGGGVVGGIASSILATVLATSPAGPVPNRLAFIAVSAVAAAGVGSGVTWRKVALIEWRELCDVRDDWLPRWQILKIDPAPDCLETCTVGPFRVTIFAGRAGLGADQLFALASKLPALLQPGTLAAIIPTPGETRQGPQAGTIHPTKVRIVTWQDEEWPDMADVATTPEVAQMACDTAVSMNMLTGGIGPAVPLEVEAVQSEGSPSALWRARIAWPRGPGGEEVRVRGAGAGGMTGGMLGAALLDHRDNNGDALYFGSPSADTDPAITAALTTVQTEDDWNTAWKAALKTGANPPAIQPKQSLTAQLASGATIERTAFAVRTGEDVNKVMTAAVERTLATSMKNISFVTIASWTQSVDDRQGTRHKQAFTVYLSHDKVPASAERLAPGRSSSQANNWLLAGHMNTAFDQLRLPRPEVTGVRCLTKSESRTHVWEIRLRLYGTTFGDIRGMGERLRQAMGVTWLRVKDAEDGCIVYAGAQPRKVQLARPGPDGEMVTRLDWDQAWVDAKLSGVGGRVPRLTSVESLPNNTQVQVLDFELCDGVDREMIVKAMPKLRTNTGNTYLELRPGTAGARTIRFLACVDDPMPTRVDFDPTMAAASKAGFAFATGVEGDPVAFDPEDAAHLAVLGGTGSGKTVSAQIIVSAAISAGFEIHIADPTKGAADLLFLEPWASSFSTTMGDTEAALEYVYAEVRRRVDINKTFGCDYRNVPAEHAYGRIMVVMDEFESLYKSQEMVGKPSDDPNIEETREKAIAHNAALARVLDICGRIAREARSAGVVMVVIGQTMIASEMEKVGLKTLKNNLGRLLMGMTTFGARSSALKNAQDAPDLGDSVPRGRGLYESMIANAVAVQVWFANQAELTATLSATVELAVKTELLSYHRKAEGPQGPAVKPIDMDAVAPVSTDMDLGEMELSLDALEMELDSDEPDDPTDGVDQPVAGLEAELPEEQAAAELVFDLPTYTAAGELELEAEVAADAAPERQPEAAAELVFDLPTYTPATEQVPVLEAAVKPDDDDDDDDWAGDWDAAEDEPILVEDDDDDEPQLVVPAEDPDDEPELEPVTEETPLRAPEPEPVQSDQVPAPESVAPHLAPARALPEPALDTPADDPWGDDLASAWTATTPILSPAARNTPATNGRFTNDW